ncbi:DUF3899 domain-containing protein [Oceanobacillus senegalensis]|uniref:DUF3899 domain-containing protein n=1 Tax=Oceanobacillus senegalensis TaxID=1936063 RepID=UPI000A305AB6|nr:DUF3899 domain-containing protein [Oceanobacillus senegalensis]
MKKQYIYLIITILIIALFYLFSFEYTFVNLINIMFYFSFLYLIITLFLYTKRGGFYDGVTFGFRRFTSIMTKKDYLEEWKEKPLPSEKRNEGFYQAMKFQTLILLALFIILLILYYV